MPYGRFTYDHDAHLVKPDSVFDVASITKAIPTSSLLLQLIDQKLVALDDRLFDYVPAFNNPDRKLVTIHHLLTHTLDFGFRLSDHKNSSPAAILNTILTSPFRTKPGATFFYANATSILAGLVVEAVYRKKLDILADEHFFKPLSMNSTTFHPQTIEPERIVPTENDPWRQRLISGEIHDESAFALRPDTIAGSAGLFSTAPDLLKFCRMLLCDGVIDGKRYLSTGIIDEIQKNQLASIAMQAGLGWELNQPRYMGTSCTPWRIGKTGFTGCVIIIDKKYNRACTLLANYVYPIRKRSTEAINRIRVALADIVFTDA